MNDVIRNLPEFIDEIYNEQRLHSALGYKTPSEYEAEIKLLKAANTTLQ